MLTYPSSQLDHHQLIDSLAGDFWTDLYGDATLVSSILRTRAIAQKQIVSDIREIIASVDRRTTPIHHRVVWSPVKLYRSQVRPADLIRYGQGITFGPTEQGVLHKFGEIIDRAVCYPAPANLGGVSILTDAILNPNITLTAGTEFYHEPQRNVLVFLDDPLQLPTITLESTIDGSDEFAEFWLFQGDYNHELLYEKWGYAANIQGHSSEVYRKLLTAVYNAIIGGPSYYQLAQVLSALTDTDVIETDGEVIDTIVADHEHVVIATDKQVYKYGKNIIQTCSEQEVKQAGDQLVDTFQIYEPNYGYGPPLPRLTLPRNFLGHGFLGSLVFPNQEVPLDYSFVDGRWKYHWQIGGDPKDVAHFFNLIYNRMKAMGQDFGRLMRKAYGFIPETINPMQFLLDYVFRHNACFVVVDFDKLGPEALGMGYWWTVRLTTPPHATVFLIDVKNP